METFTMSRKEVPRAGLVKAALAGKITNQEGARALRLTVRQFKRLKARFRRQGLGSAWGGEMDGGRQPSGYQMPPRSLMRPNRSSARPRMAWPPA